MSARVPEKIHIDSVSDHVEVRGESKARVEEAIQLLHAADNVRSAARDSASSIINQVMVEAQVPVVSAATQRQIQRTVALNEELLRSGYETYESLATRRQTLPGSIRTWVSGLRKTRELFIIKLSGHALIPAVQLTPDGMLRNEVAELVKPLSDAGLDGWSLWAWLVKPTGFLSDEIPAEVASTNLERARKAAERYAAEIRPVPTVQSCPPPQRITDGQG